ncbi:MAG: hypothetical protein GTN38_02570 [Candidatus Aenigmarchaeota archaeon]|nr:hypothetical protein [Candidatus Aenigmarchaeota archaeon]NIP40520.1 hypothetical protein [Candidatus Aenigmarchaeota archaeon]NIQ18365.1 hypothetical protein [Candidatus Aenigmarchaeota archaeon]
MSGEIGTNPVKREKVLPIDRYINDPTIHSPDTKLYEFINNGKVAEVFYQIGDNWIKSVIPEKV